MNGVAGAGASSARPAKVLFIGRPNAGKSSLFNRVTGSSAHVGNFPGITVDVLEGRAKLPGGASAVIYDLPGLYAFDPRLEPGSDERVTLDFVRQQCSEGSPLALVQVLDATQLELGLGLTKNAVDFARGVPFLLAVSHLDALGLEGRELDEAELERRIGCPVVGVSARDPASRAPLLTAIENVLGRVAPGPLDWRPAEVAAAVVRSKEGRRRRPLGRDRSDRIDGVLLHPVLGPILFLLIMGGLFTVVFLVADPASAVCDALVQGLGRVLRPALGKGALGSLVVDGVLAGAGTVMAFLPQVVLLIGAMEVLESTGYLARAAFLVDRLFRVAGLGGKAFVPLLTAHACAVPAVTATRVLRDPWERLTTMLVVPLMTCSARLPVYSLLITTFFGGSAAKKALICTALYVVGMLFGLVSAVVLRRTLTKGRRALPLVLEMPHYRRPLGRAVLVRCAREGADFLKKTGTVIVAVSVVLWVLLHVPVTSAGPGTEAPIERSAAAMVGRLLEPITRPLGFDWRINVGLIGAFGARELMVGTLGVIYGVEDADQAPAPLSQKIAATRRQDGQPAYTTATAVALLAFFVLACQCMSTLSAVRRETHGWRWPAFLLGYTYALAYIVAAVAFQTTRLLGG